MKTKVFNYGAFDLLYCQEFPNKFLKRTWFQIPNPQTGEIRQIGVFSRGEIEEIISPITFGQAYATYDIDSEEVVRQFKKVYAPKGEIEIISPEVIIP